MGDSNSALRVPYVHWEGLKAAAAYAWRIAALSRGVPPGRRVGPVSVKDRLRLTGCVKHGSLPLLLPITGLGAAFLLVGGDLADLATVSVASCGQPPVLQWGRCTLQHVLIPASRGLKAGDKVSYIGLTSERAFWTLAPCPIKRSVLLEVPVEFPLSC